MQAVVQKLDYSNDFYYEKINTLDDLLLIMFKTNNHLDCIKKLLTSTKNTEYSRLHYLFIGMGFSVDSINNSAEKFLNLLAEYFNYHFANNSTPNTSDLVDYISENCENKYFAELITEIYGIPHNYNLIVVSETLDECLKGISEYNGSETISLNWLQKLIKEIYQYQNYDLTELQMQLRNINISKFVKMLELYFLQTNSNSNMENVSKDDFLEFLKMFDYEFYEVMKRLCNNYIIIR